MWRKLLYQLIREFQYWIKLEEKNAPYTQQDLVRDIYTVTLITPQLYTHTHVYIDLSNKNLSREQY